MHDSPSPRPLRLDRPLVVFDIEATGMNVARDRIVEIAGLKIRPDGGREERTWRLHPERSVPDEVVAIHGLGDEELADCPTFADIAGELRDWLDGCDLAGYHSNRFDVPILVEEFLRAGVGFDDDRRYVDVQRIFMRMEPRTLGAAYRFFCGRELEGAHRAANDARATWEVLQAQLERYGELADDVPGLATFSLEQDYVDFGRRMVWKDGREVFWFGKHKGRAVEEVFEKEPAYCDWILKGEFPRHTKLKVKMIWLRMKHLEGRGRKPGKGG